MIYTCKDCSYRGKKSGQDGSCLACGSFNIGRESVRRKNPAPGKLRMAPADWIVGVPHRPDHLEAGPLKLAAEHFPLPCSLRELVLTRYADNDAPSSELAGRPGGVNPIPAHYP